MAEIVVTCEFCGRPGGMIGGGIDARARCPVHLDVVDAEEWLRSRAAMSAMFESEQEALAHFWADYGAGLDLVRELQRESVSDTDCGDVPVTRH
ncbi:hypothetical protein ACTJK5_10515 [Agrobacterium sp. 22094]|uniref:hypothetical protein n=1 Tax=Agrobacterium sp. 22094 TaxID=3453872 RepID=UPI003F87C081